MAEKIYRLHYRGQLKENISYDMLEEAVRKCMENVRRAQEDGRVLTAALYRYDRMLFFYYEALGEPLAVMEPIAMTGYAAGAESAALAEDAGGKDGAPLAGDTGGKDGALLVGDAGVKDGVPLSSDAEGSGNQAALEESGEDVQTTCVRPEELLMPLESFLQVWPGQKADRLWVHMYYIYYHSVPESAEQWKRAAVPEKRRGRIAFLRDDKLFSYTYFHKAIVDEGLLTGDRYQSIALHENILFSYFEEPKTFVNVQGDASRESQVINDWLAVDPESHFIHMPQGKGENFMFLPALFAMGVEDM